MKQTDLHSFLGESLRDEIARLEGLLRASAQVPNPDSKAPKPGLNPELIVSRIDSMWAKTTTPSAAMSVPKNVHAPGQSHFHAILQTVNTPQKTVARSHVQGSFASGKRGPHPQ